MFDIDALAAVDPHADEAVLVEQIGWFERVKSAAAAGQAKAAAALDVKQHPPSHLGTRSKEDHHPSPNKVTALVPVSREAARDTSPGALEETGNSIARSLVKKVDSAFFGDTVSNGPDGLESILVSKVRSLHDFQGDTHLPPARARVSILVWISGGKGLGFLLLACVDPDGDRARPVPCS